VFHPETAVEGTVERAVECDVVVVGAGAAGLAAAIVAARAEPRLRIHCVDGARHIGAKILVSGGSRCNVTNRTVDARDFWGGSSRLVRRVLRAFPAARAAEWFGELGVSLHEEEDGKLFPDTNRARTVLDALVAEARRSGVALDAGRRVVGVAPAGGGFVVEAGRAYRARVVVLATGGRSLPKSGSDGFGYELARRLGHGHVPTTPALVPLLLRGERHAALAGVTHPAVLSLRVDGRTTTRLEGSLLWTHVGVSGPVVLNLSRHWHRAVLERDSTAVRVEVSLSVCPGDTLESLDRWLLGEERARPRARLGSILADRLPASVADRWLQEAGIERDRTLAHVTRADRRRLVRQLLEVELDVHDSRGYTYAEVTAGGVPLDEVDSATMQSRRCPGVYLVGEIVDVDGRLGGFNFQWAWSSGWVAGHGVARALAARLR
jgi:predicted Rossmann fold flavoprotein